MIDGAWLFWRGSSMSVPARLYPSALLYCCDAYLGILAFKRQTARGATPRAVWAAVISSILCPGRNEFKGKLMAC